jgi:hypothetical protein
MAEIHFSTAPSVWPEVVRLVDGGRLLCGARGSNLIATQNDAHVTCQRCTAKMHRTRAGDCLCGEPVRDHFTDDNVKQSCVYAKQRNGHLAAAVSEIARAIRAEVRP